MKHSRGAAARSRGGDGSVREGEAACNLAAHELGLAGRASPAAKCYINAAASAAAEMKWHRAEMSRIGEIFLVASKASTE